MRSAVYKSYNVVDPDGMGLKARRPLPGGTVLEDLGPVWVIGQPPWEHVGTSDEYVSGRGGHFQLRVSGALTMSYFINEARGNKKPNIQWNASCSHGSFKVQVTRPIQAGEELLVKYS